MCLAQGHNTVMPVRLQPAAPQSPVKHSTNEPLRSLLYLLKMGLIVPFIRWGSLTIQIGVRENPGLSGLKHYF